MTPFYSRHIQLGDMVWILQVYSSPGQLKIQSPKFFHPKLITLVRETHKKYTQ